MPLISYKLAQLLTSLFKCYSMMYPSWVSNWYFSDSDIIILAAEIIDEKNI